MGFKLGCSQDRHVEMVLNMLVDALIKKSLPTLLSLPIEGIYQFGRYREVVEGV